MGATLTVDKHWTSGGELYITISSEDREALVNGVRQRAMDFVNETPDLRSWSNAGAEKADCPVAYDPANPDADALELQRENPEKKFNWRYKQTVRLVRGI
jgi:hypothetical protein